MSVFFFFRSFVPVGETKERGKGNKQREQEGIGLSHKKRF